MATDQLPALPTPEKIMPPHSRNFIAPVVAFTREQAEAIQREAFEAGKRAAIAADRARAVPVELERNVQPSINLSVQMPKIELQDPELDATDPHTRLLLLAEYWKREAMRHKDRADTQREELLRTWHVLHTFGAHPGRTDDRLADCVRNALMARPPAPEQPADLSGQAATAAGEREAFEAWLGRESFTERSDSGKYVSAHVDAMWSAWQARASLSTPASPVHQPNPKEPS